MERINIYKTLLIILISSIIILSINNFGSLALKLFIIGIIIFAANIYQIMRWNKMDAILFRIERQPEEKISTVSKDMPTATAGIVVCQKPLTTPYSKTPCVFYHYIKEEYIQSGKNSHWVEKENYSRSTSFDIKDNTGQIEIDSSCIDSDLGQYGLTKQNTFQNKEYNLNSEIDAENIKYQVGSYEKIGSFLGFDNKRKIRQTEYVLKPGQEVFVYGWVFSENKRKYISEHEYAPLIISRKTKEEFIDNFSANTSSIFTFNLLFLFSAFAFYISARLLFNAGIWLFILFIFLIFVRIIIQIYNKITVLENRLSNSLSQIDIEIKKRIDLIPSIELIVKKYSEYEKNIFDDVLKSRENMVKSAPGIIENESKIAIYNQNIIALAEKHPELNSNKNFIQLQNNISEIENNIAHYRSFYSKNALKYNSLISIFPLNIISPALGFKKAEYWSEKQT